MSNYEPVLKSYEGISLKLDWFFLSQLKFVQGTSYIHEDSCEKSSENDWECTCNPKSIEMVSGQLRVFRQNGPSNEDDKKYFYVAITAPLEEYIEYSRSNNLDLTKIDLLWKIQDLYPQFLIEDIKNGMLTLYHYLKYYESTGKILDLFNIDTKELDNILYDRV
jgi:hypothetical protein